MKFYLRKTLLTAGAVVLGTFGLNANTPDKTVSGSTPAETLKNELRNNVVHHRTMFGHHDDTVYGHEWTATRGEAKNEGRSDIQEVTGYYPAVMSWDLGGMELESPDNLDGVPFEMIRRQAQAQNARGGVNVFSWHPRNPVNGADSWNVERKDIVNKIRTDAEVNKKYQANVRRLAQYLKSMTDENGKPFGVVFRPWHEMTGGWFWWGLPNCNPEDYKYLWTEMRRIFDEEKVDNIVWSYSPDRVNSEEQYLAAYPGDDYVDVLGCDVYDFQGQGDEQAYQKDANTSLFVMTNLARKHDKIPAFTETGLEGVTNPNWYTSQLLPLLKKYRVAYVVVWRNAEDNKKHYYAPYPGHPATEDFKAFVNDNTIIMAGKPTVCGNEAGCGRCAGE